MNIPFPHNKYTPRAFAWSCIAMDVYTKLNGMWRLLLVPFYSRFIRRTRRLFKTLQQFRTHPSILFWVHRLLPNCNPQPCIQHSTSRLSWQRPCLLQGRCRQPWAMQTVCLPQAPRTPLRKCFALTGLR